MSKTPLTPDTKRPDPHPFSHPHKHTLQHPNRARMVADKVLSVLSKEKGVNQQGDIRSIQWQRQNMAIQGSIQGGKWS
jgi:hypothetical protein